MGQEDVPREDEVHSSAQVLTFLIADIRGYTLFTQEFGDEAAGRLAGKFADIARELVTAHHGKLVELRGDEALCVFTSTRDAIRAALELQARFVDETLEQPELPLKVGVGLDVGEAVSVEDGYRGGALNLAARLCGHARGGEILATREVTHLARRVEGSHYEDRGSVALKGMADPVVVVRIVPEGEDPVERLLALAPPAPTTRRVKHRWLVAGAIGVALALVAAAIAVPLLRSDPQPSVTIVSNSVARLDADGRVGLASPLGQRPGASAIGFGSLWVTEPDVGRVARVDLDSGSVVDTIRVGTSPTGVAVGGESVWVTNADDGTVSRIDPTTNEEQITFDAGSRPTGIAFGDDALWVADALGAQLLRVDPTSGESRSVPLAGQAFGVAFTPEGVWVTVAPSALWRIDPATLEVTLRQGVGSGPKAVISAYSSIWVASDLDNTVSRLTPSTGQVDATVKVGEGPSALGAAGGFLWVASEFDDSISSIDPDSNVVAEVVPIGGSAASLTADDDELWLAMGAATLEHRGGTLTVSDAGFALTTLDPGVRLYNDPVISTLLSITNDGLLSFKKVGGAEGATLVPDLAAALPEVSLDGLSYRFPLRAGIRYSNGEPVRPEDFRHALERAYRLRTSDAAIFFDALVGAPECAKRPATCDLSEGIRVDEDAVTYVLSRPYPDLPLRLTLPAAFPVPASTPFRDQRLKPVPATGPYQIESASKSEIRLVRNPEFEEWSGAAQPDGLVDAISWRFEEEPAEALGRLSAGERDLMWQTPADDLEGLLVTDPGRVVTSSTRIMHYVGFDVSKPPFDDRRVRQALNLAIDRAHILELAGGPAGQRVACQIVPPNFSGHEPFCPHTLHPDEGVWSAPDLDRARALIAESGAEGARLTMWIADFPYTGSDETTIMEYVVERMNELGLRAELQVEADIRRYTNRVHSGGAPGGYLFSWATNFPIAAELISLFRCDAGTKASGFCSKRLDARMDEASELQATDPAAANALWIDIEHELVEGAIWAPLLQPVDGFAFSDRVGNVQAHALWGVLLSRIWVR